VLRKLKITSWTGPWGSKRKPSAPAPALDELFDGSDELFKSIVPRCRVYGEYGCGASTRWVLGNTTAKVLAVDTSKDWIETIDPDHKYSERFDAHWVDVGDLGKWGRPLSYDNRDGFQDYTDWMWRQAQKPDLVLVDGRFRVCCFLTALKYADEGTEILFDDYGSRRFYHIVEEFVRPSDACGRQRLFIVPRKSAIDQDELDANIRAFRYVFD